LSATVRTAGISWHIVNLALKPGTGGAVFHDTAVWVKRAG